MYSIEPAFYLWVAIFCGFITAAASAQDIYKWKDEKGQWHFSQTPPSQAGGEKLNLPTPETERVKSREEWQRFYAAFQDDKYKIAGPTPHTRALIRLIDFSLRVCHITEGVAAAATGVGKRDLASQMRQSAQFCVSEAEAVFVEMYQKSQAELSREKPSALAALRSLGTTWLSMIRRVPRFDSLGALQRSQERDAEELGRRRSELDLELM